MTVQMDPVTRKVFRSILDDAKDLSIATNRQDGFPQATVVSFVHDGDVIYFACGSQSQKARNIAADDRVSVTVTAPYDDWNKIRGVSMGAHALPLTDEKEAAHAGELMMKRFPEALRFEDAARGWELIFFRLDPVAISIIDYARGFGHAELHMASPLKAGA